MDGFSKMNLLGSTKQRSMELLDLLSLPQNPKPVDINTTSSGSSKAAKSHKTKQTTFLEHSHSHSPSSQPELEDDDSDSYSDGEQQSSAFLLHRSRSVSSEAAPHRFWFYKAQGKAKTQAAAAVKRAFSMRRSLSYSSSSSVVSDQRHSRTINGRCLTMYSPFGDDNTGDAAQSIVNNNNNIALQTKKKKKKISKLQQRTGKIFKACKGILGL